MNAESAAFTDLCQRIRACQLCAAHLPLGPNPVFQADPRARILIAGQAPGIHAHRTSKPFTDQSGDRLRAWMGVSREVFYDPAKVAIVPMGFCYPGRAERGDLPPRPECAPAWRAPLLAGMPQVRLTVLIGMYAQRYHLGAARKGTLAETVHNWREYWPRYAVLPHPSPRNNGWLKDHPWFGEEFLGVLRSTIRDILASP